MTPATLAYVLTGVLLNAAAQLLLKAATRRLGALTLDRAALFDTLLRVTAQPGIWAGLLCYGLSMVLWIVALSRTEVSLAYPFLSLGYVVVTFAAWRFFGEVPGTQRIAALALICVGVAFLFHS
jgi:drug/metabolite transporter (DMT)-like permease